MMTALDSHLRAHADAALTILESLSPGAAAPSSDQLGEVTRQLVELRDKLIRARRTGTPCEEWLRQTNAILSSIFGTEFPVNGLHWQRVCETRDALRNIIADV